MAAASVRLLDLTSFAVDPPARSRPVSRLRHRHHQRPHPRWNWLALVFRGRRDPRLPSKIYQGITTEITGEGESVAPLNEAIRRSSKKQFELLGIQADWQT